MILIAFLIQVSSYLYCVPPGCSSCSTGALYSGYRCVPFCPYPIAKSATSCSMAWNKVIFSHEFLKFMDFTASSYNNFNTPGNLPFKDISKTGPIPTLSQGFYFTKNSSLSNITDISIAPDFFFRVYGIFKRPGDIFQLISNGTTFLRVFLSESTIFIEIKFMDSSGFISKINSRNIDITIWDFLYVKLEHYPTGEIYLNFQTSKNYSYITSTLYEFMPPAHEIEFLFGSRSNTGFEGFLLTSSFINGKYSNYYTFDFRLTCLCDYNQYCDSSSVCTNCSANCEDWPWCLLQLSMLRLL